MSQILALKYANLSLFTARAAMHTFELHPIGIAHTPFKHSRGIPRQGGGPARIEVFQDYLDALQGVDRCSHIWVLGFLHQADRSILRARPRKSNENASPNGVFSMRSPVRPNPIGMTCARILQLRRDQVVVDRLDFVDQTPIIDLKPYSPGWDLIPAATSSHRYDPSYYTESELTDALTRDAINALGPDADFPALPHLIDGLRSCVLEHNIDLRERSTRFEVDQPDARIDVLLCSTGAAFGNQRLAIGDLPEHVMVRVRSGDRVIDIARRRKTTEPCL